MQFSRLASAVDVLTLDASSVRQREVVSAGGGLERALLEASRRVQGEHVVTKNVRRRFKRREKGRRGATGAKGRAC